MMLRLLTLLCFGAASSVAFAQATDDGVAEDDEDDVLDDILGGGDTKEQDIKDLSEGRIEDDERVGVRADQIALPQDAAKRKRLIKTLQRKEFIKVGRFEGNVHGAFVANDPFLKRYIIGGALGYNLTEIFEVEVMLDFSPDLGTADWKPLTTQLVEKNKVTPDISKMLYFGSASFLFSPIYGKAAINGRKIINFDMFGAFGMGVVATKDDCSALGNNACSDPRVLSTQNQQHPTTNFGGGARVVLNNNIAVRVDARSVVYIETIQATTLEMKQNFLLQGGVSFFLPNSRR